MSSRIVERLSVQQVLVINCRDSFADISSFNNCCDSEIIAATATLKPEFSTAYKKVLSE